MNKNLITTKQLIDVYGKPDPDGKYLVMIDLPFPLILQWGEYKTTKKMQVHKLLANKVKAIFEEILLVYGYDKIHELGIDRFGGCFAFRVKRGGSDYSVHCWGAAIDLDPARNKLNETKKTARFARPEYKPMIDIFYKHGFVSLGREADFDWMHFQVAPPVVK